LFHKNILDRYNGEQIELKSKYTLLKLETLTKEIENEKKIVLGKLSAMKQKIQKLENQKRPISKLLESLIINEREKEDIWSIIQCLLRKNGIFIFYLTFIFLHNVPLFI
jgi:methionine synthase II (cobalamin-independent)